MKMIPSRDLVMSPAKVWRLLEDEGSVVITKDGKPRGILLPTSDQTLLDDLHEHTRSRARRAVSEIRRQSRKKGLDTLSVKEIDSEIMKSRISRKRRTQK